MKKLFMGDRFCCAHVASVSACGYRTRFERGLPAGYRRYGVPRAHFGRSNIATTSEAPICDEVTLQ